MIRWEHEGDDWLGLSGELPVAKVVKDLEAERESWNFASAGLAKVEAFKRRMDWRFRWVSSFGSDFNHDYNVSFTPEQKVAGKVDYNYAIEEFPSDEAPGASVFYKDPVTGEIFHTYSVYARGLEPLIVTYTLLDLVPKGRDEDHLSFSMECLRHHDRYGTDLFLDPTRPYWPPAASPVSCHPRSARAPTEAQT